MPLPSPHILETPCQGRREMHWIVQRAMVEDIWRVSFSLPWALSPITPSRVPPLNAPEVVVHPALLPAASAA
jgi:hypothetical protein